MPTTNMSLNAPSVGQTAGPDWATEVNANFETIDQHDHTSGKGVQLTPSALNINSDLEFNGNAAIELKRLTFDSSATGSGTNYSVYQSGGNLYWYNGSGQAVQITNGANVKTTGGSIDGMSGTDAQVLYGSGIYRFEFDTTKTPFTGAKMAHGDILLYKYDGSSGSDAYVILKYTGSSAGSNNITVPDETGTMLTTSTSYGGNISIAATGGSNTITLDAEGDINLDSNSGVLTFKDNGTAIGKISNSSSDLVIENEVDAKDIIFKQYDGNEVVRMADDRRLYFFDKGGEYIYGDGTDLNINSGTAINLNAGVLDLSAQTVDVTLNGAVDALNFDSNTLSIDASNNRIGIGNAAPSVALEIKDTGNQETVAGFGANDNGTAFISVRTAETQNNTAGIAFDTGTTTPTGVGSSNTLGYMLGKVMNSSGALQGELQFWTNDGDSLAQRMVITEAGNVGIGIESPTSGYKLDVVNNGATGIRIGDTSDNSRVLSQLDNETFTTSFTKDGSGFNTTFKFKTQNTAGAVVDHLWLENGGDVNVKTGNVVIGTAGNGIDFSNASGSHNPSSSVLNDYEEGHINNYMLAGGVVKTSTNFAQKDCTYIKIGRVCVVSYLINTAGANQDLGTSALTLGLPFTSHSTDGYTQGKYTVFISGSGFQYNYWCRISNGANVVDLYSGNNTSGTMNGIGNNQLKFYLCLTYMTA